MKTPSQQANNRGSALLIVLGLLGFLMISSVAFSITMRTEFKAAAAYRQNVMARDLIDSAFAEAMYALEFSMEKSAKELANMSRDEKRRREYLCPFKDQDTDAYGRLISSSNDSDDVQNNGDIAYLLDERAMRHIPPYVAFDVFDILERGGKDTSLDQGLNSRDEDIYSINNYAKWRPIKIKTPRVDMSNMSKGNQIKDVTETIIGRMAWSIINLSDSLDINGVGSVSPLRGIGLTGNEFAYTDGKKGADGLFQTGADLSDLPILCTNADLSQYSALSADSGDYFGNDLPNYSWIFAASEAGEEHRFNSEAQSILSPFSVYSFWPNPSRGKHTTSQTNTTPANAITQDSIDSGEAETIFEEALFSQLGASTAQNVDIRKNFLRLVGDYIDKDQTPTYDGETNDYLNHCFPCAENVPMVNEVAYDASETLKNEALKNTIDESIVKKIEHYEVPEGELNAYTTLGNANFNDELKIKLPKDALTLKVALGAYSPLNENNSSSTYDLYAKGYVAVSARSYLDNKENKTIITQENAVIAEPMKETNGGSIQANGDVFFKGNFEDLAAENDIEIVLDPKDIPIRVPSADKSQNVKIRCLVDFFFRAEIKGSDGLVDRVPVSDAYNRSAPSIDKEEDVKTMLEIAYTGRRNDMRTMGVLDGQFFRVTKAIEITFSVQLNEDATLKVCGADGKGDAEAKLVDTTVSFGNESIVELGSGQPSPLTFFPPTGLWSTIDPRYNWISPMFGIRDEATAYIGTQGVSITKSLSSPHWLFQENVTDLTAEGLTPSEVQQAYQTTHANIVPFVWGLNIEDIRYNTNDTGTLLMPSELASVPVPKATNVWYSETNPFSNYLQHSVNAYHENVGQESFFRTIPIIDFDDGVVSSTEQVAYNDIINTLSSFSGMPEEHRSIMSVYAGQDNYILGQRLRRLAMKGIPASIKDAIAISATRIDAATKAGRINDDFAKDIKSLASGVTAPTTACPKYDTFINDYLFPIPKESSSVDWPSQVTASDNMTPEDLRASRPQNAKDPLGIFGKEVTGISSDNDVDATYFAKLIELYNTQAKVPNGTTEDNQKLGQNDINNLIAFSRECFGDRQQLFLLILRVDATAAASEGRLHEATPTSTTRAVALVWRDAYGELPPRIIYRIVF